MNLVPDDMSEFIQGVAQFNSQDYYACHDTLESLWMSATEPEKKFYQGVLQVAVGCYHLGNANLKGASILLGEGINKLQRYRPDYLGIDVDKLIAESAELLASLQAFAIREGMAGKLSAADVQKFPLPQISSIATFE